MHQPKLYVSNDDEEELKGKAKKRKKEELRAEDETKLSTKSSSIPDCSDFFHISLAWSLSPQQLNEETFSSNAAKDVLDDLSTNFDVAKVKIGNAITSVPLSTKTSESRSGILGL